MYSFTKEVRKFSVKKGPGPADYVNNSCKNIHGGIFDKSPKNDERKQKSPGVGDYNIEQQSKKGPLQFSFTKTRKFYTQKS